MREYGSFVKLKDAGEADAAFAKLRSLGFSYCHLVYKPECYTEEAARIIRTAAEKSDVRIVAMFAGFNDPYTKWDIYEDYKLAGINSKLYGEKRIKYIKTAAAFAKSLGVEDILIHAGFIANDPFSAEYEYMKKCLGGFASYCKEIGMNILLETGGESPVTLLRIIEELEMGNIFVNLDTANLIMYGYGNPVDAVPTLGKHIRSMHVKDGTPPTSPYKLGKEVPVGTGFVDFKRVFEELERVGFNGPIIIEREISGEAQLADLKAAIEYLNTEIFSEG